ncbi:MAG TPA: diaminopimelate decarboxylase [Clostridia bacterium]|nr:diaminopimelate decarboxylase [Clostridia bacterium]
MNTRDTLKVENGQLVIGGVSATELREKFGTPLYVLDEAYIREVSRAFLDGLKEGYGENVAVAYASKALCNIAVLKITSSEGLYTDIVSGGELYTALKAGVQPEKMVMHGNNKTDAELKMAVENSVGYIVVDSFNEIEKLDKIAKDLGKKPNVLLRVNPLVTAHTHEAVQTAKADSKFGIVIGDEAERAIRLMIEAENLEFVGIHCHIGSQIFDYSAYEMAVEAMTSFIKRLLDDGIEIKVLNVGGGFGVFYAGSDPMFTPRRYAYTVKNLAMLVSESLKKQGIPKPMLMIEPGRSIVAEAGITLYTVGTIKDLGVRKYIGIDGGMFDNPRYALYQSVYSAIVANKADEPFAEKVSICGKCCESGDLIGVDISLQKAELNDIVAVFSTGAYNYSMSSNYNLNAVPPMVLVKDGKADYIVKPQTYDDIIRNNCLANWQK